jgi:hypothetical protein
LVAHLTYAPSALQTSFPRFAPASARRNPENEADARLPLKTGCQEQVIRQACTKFRKSRPPAEGHVNGLSACRRQVLVPTSLGIYLRHHTPCGQGVFTNGIRSSRSLILSNMLCSRSSMRC